MDADRFDALARSFSVTALGSRRRLLRGLLSGMVGLIAAGLGRTEGSAGNDAGIIDRPSPPPRRRRPKRPPKPPRWTAPRCPKRPLQRCLKPAEAEFTRAIEPCRRQCEANPKRRACKSCIRPHAVALANAARDCTDRLCRSGTAQPAATTSAAARGTVRGTVRAAESGELRSAALPSCQSRPLTVCQNRAERNYVICLVAAGAACVGSAGFACAAGVVGCGVLYATSVSDCNEDHGCSPGVCLPSNVCCPTGFHTPCGDTCCPPEQVCENGSCKCSAEKCSGRCPCPAGETCLSTGCCPTDRVTSFGTCRPCPPEQACGAECCPFGQVCDGGTTCKCPGGVRQCGDTCCHAAAVGCEGNRCLNQCDIDGDCGG